MIILLIRNKYPLFILSGAYYGPLILFNTYIYYIDTDEIPEIFLLLKTYIFIARSEDTIFIAHV